MRFVSGSCAESSGPCRCRVRSEVASVELVLSIVLTWSWTEHLAARRWGAQPQLSSLGVSQTLNLFFSSGAEHDSSARNLGTNPQLNTFKPAALQEGHHSGDLSCLFAVQFFCHKCQVLFLVHFIHLD